LEHLEQRARGLGVRIALNRLCRAGELREGEFDAILLATGSVPERQGYSSHLPSVRFIPGWDLPHVLSSFEVLTGEGAVGQHVLVVDNDPHGHAVTVAEHLAAAGKLVTIVCPMPNIGFAFGPSNELPIYRRLFRAGVQILEHTWVEEIGEHEVRCSNVYSRAAVEVGKVDTVVMATGNVVRDDLYHELRRALPKTPVTRIGDCLAPRRLDDAIWDGYHAAYALQ
jgi:pyruvate/2-oxoglutarate dehydrogenase complex dihydrolipoamide dehydrogenase (E3) component